VCLGLVSLCLSLTFLGALPGGVSPDRAARNTQRSRVSRCPRHRIVTGISQEPVSLRSAFVKTSKAADPPPAEIAQAPAKGPLALHAALIAAPSQPRALAALQVDTFFARPPPGLIA